MAKSSSSLGRSQQKREGQNISASVSKIFKLIVFQINHVSLTSADSYRCDSYCLGRVSKICLPHPSTTASLVYFAIFKVLPT